MAQLMIVGNPRRRSRRRRARRARRRARRMTALQRQFFAPRRRRRRSIVRARRRVYRRQRGFLAPRAMTFNVNTALNAAQTAAAGAVGAVVMDAAMSVASRVLPVGLSTRYTETGGINIPYHLTRGLLTVGLGVLGARMLPAGIGRYAAQGAVGALTVQGYEILRSVLPVEWTMGAYFNPARVVHGGLQGLRGNGNGNMLPSGRYLPTLARGGLGASFPAGTAFPRGSSETRIGEGAVW